jgi:signal transduction histidine kinase
VSIRSKLLIIFLVFGIAPMLLVSTVNYVSGTRTIERMLREDVEENAARITREVENVIRAHEAELAQMSRLASLHDYIGGKSDASRQTAATNGDSAPMEISSRTTSPAPLASAAAAKPSTELPDELRARFNAFYVSHQNHLATMTCLNAEQRPLFHIKGVEAGGDGKMQAQFQTTDFVSASVRADERVWQTDSALPLHSPVTGEASGAFLRVTIPVFLDGAAAASGNTGARGALVVEMKVAEIFKQAEAAQSASNSGANDSHATAAPTSFIVALDGSQNIVYHTSDAFKHRSVAAAMPFFKPIADKMTAGKTDVDSFEDKAADGDRWLAAFRPISDVGLSVAAAKNSSAVVGGLQRAGLSGVALALLAALVATALLVVLVGRTSRRIERVAEGAAAVAGGDLNQHIELHTNDETRVLAESFNRMTDRLREHIQREAETRQFQSFMRLSAMLTHDLKNSIQGLSMLVNNMEKQFHRAEFRADAIDSLREATDKLRRLVARLSEPVKSLSGEYRRDAKPTDLVPIINRVLDTTARASASLYRIRTRLPSTLMAFCEPERIENVIENLIINAMEAMGTAGGELTVEAEEQFGERIFFSVSDTGVGMSEDFINNRLFKPFSTTKSKGIGLGLFTCREIVETHGGRLEVESQVGIGTRFRVMLPSKPLTLRERLEQSQGSSPKADASGTT